MKKLRALELALSFLQALSEADNLFDDYIEDEGITVEEYSEMLETLEKMKVETHAG
jgi:hypothetical protein